MKNENNFFKEIEDTLHSYDEGYIPGAWEEFQQKKKRKKMGVLFFRVAGVAAALLLFSYVTFQFFIKQEPSNNEFTQTKVIQHPNVVVPESDKKSNEAIKNIITADAHGKEHQPDNSKNTNEHMAWTMPLKKTLSGYADNEPVSGTPIIANAANEHKADKVTTTTDTVLAKPVSNVASEQVIAKTNAPKYSGTAKPIYDSLVRAANHQVININKKEIKNLTYSVVVLPAVGNQKINVGTGLEVAYKINNNLFISGGISYSSLNAMGDGNNNPDPFKKTQQVSLDVSGFEVPIGLQYRTNSGFYITAGVSGMTVLKDHLQYNYIAQSTVTMASFVTPGTAQPALRVVPEQKTEDSKEKINNYLGFYMLSVGKKKAIGRNQLNFGPFVRVPFGAVSSEKIQLTQGGIRLGLDF